MAWGIWNNIKKGFQKAGRAIVKGAKWLNEKVIKPFKLVVKTIAGTVANALVPSSGAVVNKAVDVVSDGIDTVNSWVSKKKRWNGLTLIKGNDN